MAAMQTRKVVADLIPQVRRWVRDEDKAIWTDDLHIAATYNQQLLTVWNTLKEIESLLIVQTEEVDLVAGTREYTPATDYAEPIWDLCRLSVDGYVGEEGLRRYNTLDAVHFTESAPPAGFYDDGAGNIGMLPTPDDAATYVLVFRSFAPAPIITEDAAGIAADLDVPWADRWYLTLARMTQITLEAEAERSTAQTAGLLQMAWDQSMIRTYQHGVIHRAVETGFFDAEGV